jgi:Flp pilus assembly protein TadD
LKRLREGATNLGIALVKQKEFDEAIVVLKEAVRLASNDPAPRSAARGQLRQL